MEENTKTQQEEKETSPKIQQEETHTSPKIQQEELPSKSVAEKIMEIEHHKDEEDKKDESDGHNQAKEIDGKKESPAVASPSGIQKSSSFKEESSLLSDLKEYEKKALSELRSKIEDAIHNNILFERKKEQAKEFPSTKDEEDKDHKEKSTADRKEEAPEKDQARSASNEGKEEEKEMPAQEEKTDEKEQVVKENIKQEDETVDKDIALWGVPLLPSKGDSTTDVLMLKLLRAREYRVNDAFEMLRNILKWRKENKIDSIMDEDVQVDLSSMAYMEGHDRNGHPICFNVFGALGNDELYGKAFEEKREKFMRGRIQLMEKVIQKLDFKPGAVSAVLQINDLKNTPLPTKKELRMATKRTIELFQDNYPEFVVKNIFINVPFWYYAYSALFAPALSQRAKNKMVYARTAKVTDTLLKYIAASHIPVQYGGLKLENDSEFSVEDDAKEAIVKAGSEESIEIPAPEVGTTLMWDLTVSGWEVKYKEEFVPTDEGSYTIIVKKGRKITWHEGTIRNSFTNKEPGKVVITIENAAFKKKRILYRYKNKTSSS